MINRWDRGWLIGWRDICRSTDRRTVIASLIPRAAVGHTAPLMFTDADPRLVAALYGNLCSLALDYAARQKVGGTHLTYGLLKQLPILAPSTYSGAAEWSGGTILRASHIKPWAECATDAERLDVFNGLLLAPNLDAAFDRGFITVAENGEVLVSERLGDTDRRALSLDVRLRVSALDDGHQPYLRFHREQVFKDSRRDQLLPDPR